MRTRISVLIATILLLAGFVALNWPEFVRPVPVSLGLRIVDAPLPLILLAALMCMMLAALASVAYLQSQHEHALNRHARELQAQRELADKGEASRFLELRRYLELEALETRQRDAATRDALQDSLRQHQHALQARLDQPSPPAASML
jgi:uncharacterized membrane protein